MGVVDMSKGCVELPVPFMNSEKMIMKLSVDLLNLCLRRASSCRAGLVLCGYRNYCNGVVDSVL